MRRYRILLGLTLLFVLMLAAALLLFRPGIPGVVQRPSSTALPSVTAAATPTTLPPRPRVGYTPVPENTLSPVVVQRSPARGETLAPDGVIQLVFDRAMDQATVTNAFRIVPAVNGSFEWPDARTLLFRPAEQLNRASVYDVVLEQGAQAQDGAPLNQAYQFRFSTNGFLEVAQVIPAPGTQDAQASTTITVLFNRPVVPLVNSPDLAALPQPLRLDPPVAGRGEWLNTSIYVFHPEQPLESGRSYTGSIDASLLDIEGNPLQRPFSWQFSVAYPQVVSVVPIDGSTHISVEPVLQLQFNQPVDPLAARAAFSLSAGGASVPFEIGAQGTTLLITPTQRLQFDQRYTARLAAGLTGLSGGGGLPQDVTWSFQTVPLPRIVGTEPSDGDNNANPYGDFVINFNTAIDPATVMDHLQVTPPLSPTLVYTYFNDYNYSFHLNFGSRPSTEYQVQIRPGIADPYGNTIDDGRNVRFRTAALPPSVQLIAPDQLGTYNASAAAQVLLNSVNMPRAELELYSTAPAELRSYRNWQEQPPPASARLRQWTVTLDTPLNETVHTRVDLRADGQPLDPGSYLLVLKDPQKQWDRYHQMVVSPFNLTLKAGMREALVWANQLDNGQPAAGINLTFYADNNILGSATTDQNGVARLKWDSDRNGQIYAMTSCDATPCAGFAAIAEGWSNGISPWEFGVQTNLAYPELNAFIYTDRPIYRPGQEVSFKGIVRAEADARYNLPAKLGTVQVTINAPDGAQVYQQNLALSAIGTFDASLTLGASAALGQYVITVQAGDASFSFPFNVAAYRPPEFQVAITAPTELRRGDPLPASIDVSYFFGGPVANVPVQWNVLAEPYHFQPSALSRYSFGNSSDPWICFDCWWQPVAPPTPLVSGSGTTDVQGQLTISNLQAAIEQALPQSPISTTQSLSLIIEASASGKDNQVIAGRSALIIHQSERYVGLAARSYLASASQEQQVDLVVVDPQGQRQAGQRIELEVQRYEWQNSFVPGPAGVGGTWETREQRSTVARQTLNSDANGEAVLRFTPDEGGSYRVIARTTDARGRSSESSMFLWVASRDFVPWRRDNNDRINLISDRNSYQPGETAAILIPSPFQGPSWALVTVERAGIFQHEVLQLQSNSTVYRLPLRAEHAPNVFVSVVLFSGPEAAGQPANYKVGYLPLQVEPRPQSLTITLTPDSASTTPGSTVAYQVQVNDASGAGVVADLSLDLVDKAVLSLLPRESNAIKRAFYGERSLGIITASGLSISANRLLAQLEEQLKDLRRDRVSEEFTAINEGLTAGAAPPAQPTTAAAAADQAANAYGASPPLGVTLREQFADTAFWQASFSTDSSGRGSLQIKLPDNLTTWVLRGVAVSDDTRVGEGSVEVLATKPLLIRPVTPRFFVVGDRAELAANVSNNTAQPLQVAVALAASGVSITTVPTVTVDIPARSETQVTWQVEVKEGTAAGDQPSYADLIFSAVAGELSDAAKPRLASGPNGTLPIYRYSVAETVGTGGQLSDAGARSEIIALPPGVDSSQGEVTLRLDPSLAAGMRDGLSYLEHFEEESTEQTVSSFLPNVLAYRALKDLGISNSDLEQRLPKLVQEGLDRLALRQNSDGGWGWWERNEQSNPHLSAYVVLGLLRTREAGYAVDGGMLERGMAYLRGQLKTVNLNLDTAAANQQAFLLFVLGESGQGEPAANQALLRWREKLSIFGRAFLAMALQQSNPGDSGIQTLLSDLNNSAILSATGAHWEEDSRDWWAMNTDTRSTAIVLAALTRLDPNNQLNPNVVHWLMVARQGGIWETSQETAWALMALTDWMVHTGELAGSYDFAAWVNDTEQLSGQVAAATIDQPIVQRIAVADLLNTASNRLTIGRGPGPGVLYYTAHLRSFLPVDQLRALDRGVIVQRRYSLASCSDGPQCADISSAKVGDVIRVDLTLIAPNDLYFLRVEDPLPAGAEAIDTGLATTSLLAQGPSLALSDAEKGGWGWWWRWYSRSELRDEKVVLFADYLAKGTYEYSYTMRLTLAGEFRVIPSTASELYFPEVYGRSDGRLLTVVNGE